MTPELETPRLLLRPLVLADAEQTQLLFPQWEIVRYLNNRVPWPYPPDGAHTFYRGFWIAPHGQSQGLMTEACEVVTDYWFTTLKFPVMRVTKANANTASRRISRRQGMRMVATVERDYVSGRLPSEEWEITREEWRARREGFPR